MEPEARKDSAMSIEEVVAPTDACTPDQPGGIAGWQPGIPLLRIYACGILRVEILQEVPGGDPAQARYAALDLSDLRGRGPVPALTALSLLLHRPHRFAPTEWLREHVREHHDEGEEQDDGRDHSVTQKRIEN